MSTELATAGFIAAVKSRTVATPPGSPSTGDRYIIASSPTGAWSGSANSIASWDGTQWLIATPVVGSRVVNIADGALYQWDGTSWVSRIQLVSEAETDSSGTSEVQRLIFAQPSGASVNSAKAAIAFYDGNDLTPGHAVAWVQAHDYLHSPDTGGNNRHRHFSIETQDSSGTSVQSRLSIPYGYDTCEIGFFSANVNVVGNRMRVSAGAGNNRILELCGSLSSNLTPDTSHQRIQLLANATAEGGSNAGSDFEIRNFSDSGVGLSTGALMKRSNGFWGLLGNTSPGQALDVGVPNNTGTTALVRACRGTTSQFAGFVVATGTSSSATTEQWALRLSNDSTNDLHIRNINNGLDAVLYEQRATQANITFLGATKSYGGGVGVLQLAAANTAPTSAPSTGILLWWNGTDLKVWKSGAGAAQTVTVS